MEADDVARNLRNDDPEGNHPMNALRRFFHLPQSAASIGSSSRFDRYYSSVLRSGSGYPTADEARKDLNSYDRSFMPYGWPR